MPALNSLRLPQSQQQQVDGAAGCYPGPGFGSIQHHRQNAANHRSVAQTRIRLP
jgi:hypothetical protein